MVALAADCMQPQVATLVRRRLCDTHAELTGPAANGRESCRLGADSVARGAFDPQAARAMQREQTAIDARHKVKCFGLFFVIEYIWPICGAHAINRQWSAAHSEFQARAQYDEIYIFEICAR